MARTAFLGLAAVLAASPPAAAQTFEATGSVAAELRAFPEDPLYGGQLRTWQPSLVIEPEFFLETDDRRHQFSLEPFYRHDFRDGNRSHADVREAFWRYTADDWDMLVGVNSVFWGVTESRHLVNIINQIDAVEDTDEEDYLGQPMLNLGSQRDWGRIDFYLMSGFRDRAFPGRDGRLRAALPVDEDRDAAEFESSLGRARPEVALRWSHFIGDWDIGAHVFHGTGREPDPRVNDSGTAFIPRYEIITQAGLDLQHTSDAWLWKLEALGRHGQGDVFGAAVAGFEYTLFQVADSDADLGFLMEALYDGRDRGSFPTIQDNDIFLGTRLSLNDIQDTSLLFGGLVDIEDGSTSLRLEGERRIGDSWKVELQAVMVGYADNRNNLASFAEDSFLNLRIARYY